MVSQLHTTQCAHTHTPSTGLDTDAAKFTMVELALLHSSDTFRCQPSFVHGTLTSPPRTRPLTKPVLERPFTFEFEQVPTKSKQHKYSLRLATSGSQNAATLTRLALCLDGSNRSDSSDTKKKTKQKPPLFHYRNVLLWRSTN